MKTLDSVFLHLLTVVLTTGLWGQLDTPRISPEADVRDLYSRVINSNFVIVGTVTRSRIVFLRTPPNDVGALKTAVARGGEGELFAVAVDDVVCRQSDFNSGPVPKSSNSPGKEVQMFVPNHEPPFLGPYRQEYLIKGRRYLLFLTEARETDQKKWTATFELDPNSSYYRTLEYSRGEIELRDSDNQRGDSAVLQKVTSLCDAVRPVDKQAKLMRLETLENSGDDVLSSQAKLAAEALKKQP